MKSHLKQFVSVLLCLVCGCAPRATPDDAAGIVTSKTFGEAVIAQEAGDYAKAEKLWREELEASPDSAATYYNLGIACDALGRKQEAITSYEKAVALDPDFADARNNLGLALIDSGDLDRAVENLREAVNARPGNPNFSYNLGLALHHRKDYEEAIDCYSKAIDANPKMALALYNSAKIRDRQGRCADAERLYQQAIDANPDFWEALYNLGRRYHKAAKFEKALPMYERALALRNDNADIATNRDNVKIAINSEKEIDNALKAKPTLDAAAQYHMRGFLGRAEEYYKKAIKADPKDIRPRGNLAHVYLMQLCYQESIDLYKKVIEEDPANEALKMGLDAALQQQQAALAAPVT